MLKTKSGCSSTVSVNGAVCTKPPPLPVIASGYNPNGAVRAVVSVNTDEPSGTMGFVLQSGATPLGNPLTVSVTGAAKPCSAVMFISVVAIRL